MMSSLGALLVTAYIRNLIKSSAVFHNYYKAYYIANAWLELALVKTNGEVRGYGFEDVVASGSTTVTDNFGTGANTYFSTSISTSSASLWDINTSSPDSYIECNATNVVEIGYELAPGWCVPIILLKDDEQSYFDWTEWLISPITDNLLNPVSETGWPVNLTLFGTQWITALVTKIMIVNGQIVFDQWWSTGFDMLWEVAQNNLLQKVTDNSLTASTKQILMIANTTSNTGHYCLSSVNNVLVPTQYVTISAQWKYSNVTLDLKWVRKAWLPADFCYTAISS